MRFHGSPLQILGHDSTYPGGQYDDPPDPANVPMGGFEVPLDAFSMNVPPNYSRDKQFFVFFSSGNKRDGKVMGRSVLTRALDPMVPIDHQAHNQTLNHQMLTTFSTCRFINVSVQVRPASAVDGFGGEGDVLLVWGSGAYRADDLRLAVLDLRNAAVYSHLMSNSPFAIQDLGPRYFKGGQDRWSANEEDARPLFWPGALGELSVRWVSELGRYVLMAMSGPETDRPGGLDAHRPEPVGSVVAPAPGIRLGARRPGTTPAPNALAGDAVDGEPAVHLGQERSRPESGQGMRLRATVFARRRRVRPIPFRCKERRELRDFPIYVIYLASLPGGADASCRAVGRVGGVGKVKQAATSDVAHRRGL